MTFITCDISGNCSVLDNDDLRLDGKNADGTIGPDASSEPAAYVGEIREILHVEPNA